MTLAHFPLINVIIIIIIIIIYYYYLLFRSESNRIKKPLDYFPLLISVSFCTLISKLTKRKKISTFDIEFNRRLYGPLVSTNCTHVHSIITDCCILDMKSAFDD